MEQGVCFDTIYENHACVHMHLHTHLETYTGREYIELLIIVIVRKCGDRIWGKEKRKDFYVYPS